MTDPSPPAGASRQPNDPVRHHQPGGCGASGCLILAVVVSAILLGIVVVMALLRPGMTPLTPAQ